MTNIEKLHAELNASRYAKEIFAFLSALAAEPAFQNTKDVAQKRQILFGNVVAVANEPQTLEKVG